MKLAPIVLVVACGQHAPAPTGTPALAPGEPAQTLPAIHPLACQPASKPAEPPPPSPEDEYYRPARVKESRDACAIADNNIESVGGRILATTRNGRPEPSTPWDHKSRLGYQKLVFDRLALQPGEKALLAKQGFVVADRLTMGYAQAFHEIYQSQLPIYISVDAVLHAIYAGNDSLIADLEDAQLRPLLADTLDQLACALPAAAAEYPRETARDLDVYLAVARALIHGSEPQSALGDPTVEAEAAALVKAAVDAAEMSTVSLFGRDRVIDFTAYTPRSHYAATDDRKQFFRAGMWLSRLEFNLVSRSSRSSQPGVAPNPAETPREAIDALALADLVDKAHATDAIGKLDLAWSLLAGRREDVSVANLAELRKTAAIGKLTDADAAAKLRTAIGNNFQRTARIHYMPQGSPNLPAIATLLGPRIVPDAAATRPLVHDELADRHVLTASDMAYALGHDRALDYLGADRKQFPSLDAQLAKARSIVATAERGQYDLYSAWLDAVVGLAEVPEGVRPSFMQTPAYADLRINSALAAFGHIKHNFVLVAGESYNAGGCEIPEGYVEPAPATYAALFAYVRRGEYAFGLLDPQDKLGGLAYFRRVSTILEVLSDIISDELDDKRLSLDQKLFLSLIAEMAPGTTGGPPTYTGWWFDMFRNREQDGLATAEYIASFFTGDDIAYVGAQQPALGVFVIDTGGAPRLAVGPVARAYEHHGPVANRLTDEQGAALPAAERHAPWAASYAIPAPPEPKLQLTWYPPDPDNPDIRIETKDDLGLVTVELYDHHRVALLRMTKRVKPGKTTFRMRSRKAVEGVHLQVGAFHGWYDLGIVEPSVWATLGGYQSTD